MRDSTSFNYPVEEDYFILMNKDKKVLDFKIMYGLDIKVTETFRYLIKLPIGFTDLLSWLESRQAPKHRVHIEKLLELCGINNLANYLKITYALSLNDTFWVKPQNKDLTWNKVSLYQNDFNTTIARIAFEGGLYGLEFTPTSPEFGTDGAFAKCWTKDFDSSINLLKRGSTGARNAGLETYSEFYSSQIAKLICKDYVNYDLVKFHDKLASSCELFTSESEGYAPMHKLIDRRQPIEKLFEFYDGIGSGEDFIRMIVFDALTINTDRHLGNHGVIFDCDTMEIKRMAPVFDNNQALLPYAEDEDFANLDEYLKMKGPRIGREFIDVAKYSLTPTIRRDLANMRGFKFTKHKELNLDDDRLIKLENLVNSQIDLILK